MQTLDRDTQRRDKNHIMNISWEIVNYLFEYLEGQFKINQRKCKKK